MPHVNSLIIEQLIISALVIFFFIGGVVALAIAVGLIMRSPRVFQLFDLLNHYVSTRRATKAMAIPRDSGQFIWKHRRPIGIVFVIGAAYSVWGLVTGPNNATVVSMLNMNFPAEFVFWIVESLRSLLVIGSTASIIVGILMLTSPDTLKVVDKIASHWYSTRQIAPEAENMDMTLDNWVATFPRVAGFIIVSPALIMVMYFGYLLLKRI